MAKSSKALDLVAAVQAAQGEIPEGFKPVAFGAVLSKEGDIVCGEYQGAGKAVAIKGQKGKVTTFKVDDVDRGEVQILASAQVEQFFAGVEVGQEVWIQRGPQVKGGKGRVNTYRFAVRG